MTFDIFLNLLIIILLTVGIIYAIVLEYRLSCVKENHRNLSLLMKQFYEASNRAQKELIKLKEVSEKSRTTLHADVEQARLVRDELRFLMNKADQFKTLDSYDTTPLFNFDTDSSQQEQELRQKFNLKKDK